MEQNTIYNSDAPSFRDNKNENVPISQNIQRSKSDGVIYSQSAHNDGHKYNQSENEATPPPNSNANNDDYKYKDYDEESNATPPPPLNTNHIIDNYDKQTSSKMDNKQYQRSAPPLSTEKNAIYDDDDQTDDYKHGKTPIIQNIQRSKSEEVDDCKYNQYDYDDSESDDAAPTNYTQTQIQHHKEAQSNTMNDDYQYEYSDESESDINNASNGDNCNENEYHNLWDVLQAKHKEYGNAYRNNQDQNIFPTESMNQICRYCFMAIWSPEHKKQCLFIPEWVQNGHENPDGKAKNVMVFNGHHFLCKSNDS